MEGTAAAEVAGASDGAAGDVQIKGSKENEQPAQQPSGSVALEMPATPIPLTRDIEWSEHFSFFTSLGGFGGSTDGARGLTSVGLSNSESRPDSVTQCCLNDPDERVEELTLKNCINADVQPEVSAGGSSSSGDRPTIIKGLWGNFTRMAWRTSEVASRENVAVSCGDIANLRAGDVSSRENLAGTLDNNMSSQNNDASGKETPMSHGGNVNNEFMMPFGSQQHLLAARPNQTEQGAERENILTMSSFSNRIFDQMRSKTVTPSSGVPGSPFKNKSKGKGVACQGAREEVKVQANARPRGPLDRLPKIPASVHDSMDRVDALLSSGGRNFLKSQCEGNSLRELIKPGQQTTSKFEKMHLFKQIVDLVDKCHTQGLTLQHLRPSYFTIPSSNQVKYIGSCTTQDLSASVKQDVTTDDVVNRKRCFDHRIELQESNGYGNSMLKYQKVGERSMIAARRPIHTFWAGHRRDNQNEDVDPGASRQENSIGTVRDRFKFAEPHDSNTSCAKRLSSSGDQQSTFELRILEESWYKSPEELSQLNGTFPSNIYSLGVLLFELFCCCDTWEVHCSAMSDLRHRILPPNFLSESPKEAGFCLWLLHPDPCSRPKARDILGCDLINEGRDLSLLDQAPAATSEDDTESSLLHNFLSQLKEEKEMQAAKLSADLASLQTDMTEVERRHSTRIGFNLEDLDVLASSSALSGASANALQGALLSGLLPSLCKSSIYEERVMRNLEQLENAYYSMRSTIDSCETNVIKRSDNEALRVRENFYQLHSDSDATNEQTDRLGCFFDGLCKYARHSRFEVRGILKNADILSSPNVICSLSFDRDEEYFAAAGVSKKIKIFEFDALLNDRVDIHYPLIEMPSRSKLSCVCWNNYIKNYLASTDYDGTVQKNCIDTIRNVANVCCVQFSPYSSRMVAFGSADYKVYCYDLRNTRIPWCTISGHGKAVSYVRFLDPETLISASTDNTLKIWDLNRTNSSGLSTDSCSLTLSGHTNEKNFVGLSVHDGYITCGSETNELFSYYKTFPMPITSHKFGSIDPITGQVTNEDNQHFVSSVCWRGKSNMVVAANCSGSIKVLELV
ncbi:protein SPA1-RELATED 3-like isoform X2 [Phragmites australis]|uniref:protein SPA1-RELATED 3-like isoform X2 n=1 Tax=Phragmites australis TaxID=29695 RepID=UPI002D79A826|nr:protein SPA1-RELATED 3-like isoform X2 [Phragmites australis]